MVDEVFSEARPASLAMSSMRIASSGCLRMGNTFAKELGGRRWGIDPFEILTRASNERCSAVGICAIGNERSRIMGFVRGESLAGRKTLSMAVDVKSVAIWEITLANIIRTELRL